MFINKLNNLRIKQKLALIQIFCVLLPLLITDSVIVLLIVDEEKRATVQEMDNIAESVKYTVSSSIDNALLLMNNIYTNRFVNEFLNMEFTSPGDYYDKYTDFIKDSLYAVGVSSNRYNAVIYGDNDGIVNGGYFQRLEMIENAWWYDEFLENDKGVTIFSDYVNMGANNTRTISIVRHLDHYNKGKGKSVLKIDLDYSGMAMDIVNGRNSAIFYVCDGDRILFSNEGKGGRHMPFENISEQLISKAGIHNTINIYKKTWDIYVMTPKVDSKAVLLKNAPLIGSLICVNVILPFLVMGLINRSFTQRISELDKVFGDEGADELKQLPEVQGNDEISALMASYNRMAHRINELIEKEYKNRLRSQEIDIARQNAELLALHSQINPHFLFNALESIRMHSVLKKEFETADMVQKLALMERQNVDWGDDMVCLRDEVEFVEAYLELQKYRFGAKLSYDINVDEECLDYRLPKLSLVTFVENACVHGMENKTLGSWIFVRIYKQDDMLTVEIEDTGHGMNEEQSRIILEEMRNVSLDKLKESSHVGILNAALRLKMASRDKVVFEIDSEAWAGTMITIRFPLDELTKINKTEQT